MTEKVKLTREQADAIDTLNSAVKGMLVVDLLRAIQEGYEVEPEYKVGDWVRFIDHHNNNPHYGKIEEIKDDKAWALWNGEKFRGFIYLEDLLPMTPEEIKAEKERQLWKKIGREIFDFRIGDGYMDKSGRVLTIDKPLRISTIKELYREGSLVGFYPAESFISFEDGVEE